MGFFNTAHAATCTDKRRIFLQYIIVLHVHYLMMAVKIPLPPQYLCSVCLYVALESSFKQRLVWLNFKDCTETKTWGTDLDKCRDIFLIVLLSVSMYGASVLEEEMPSWEPGKLLYRCPTPGRPFVETGNMNGSFGCKCIYDDQILLQMVTSLSIIKL